MTSARLCNEAPPPAVGPSNGLRAQTTAGRERRRGGDLVRGERFDSSRCYYRSLGNQAQ